MKTLKEFLVREFTTVPALGKTLSSKHGYFLYDTSTNHLVQCEEMTYRLLEKLIPGTPKESINSGLSYRDE